MGRVERGRGEGWEEGTERRRVDTVEREEGEEREERMD